MPKRLKTIQGEFDILDPIRVQGLLKKRKETVTEFITKFLIKWNKDKNTVYANIDENAKDYIQTLPNKKRSIEDIYKICQYYYPKVTLKEVKDAIFNDIYENIPNMRSCICQQIHKRVFWQADKDAQKHRHYDEEDEHGYTIDNWKNANI